MKISFSKNHDPKSENGMKVQYAAGKRKISTLIWWSVLTVVFAPFLWLFVSLCMKWLLITSSGVVTMASYPVVSIQHGTIESVCVKPGQKVKAGDVLFEVKPSLTQDHYDELNRMKAELDALNRTGGQVVSVRTSGSTPPGYLKSRIAFLKKEERAYASLLKNGAATRAEYNEANQRLLEAQEARSAALFASRGSSAPVDNSGAQRKLFLASYIKMLEAQDRSTFKIYAPKDGIVENVTVTSGYDAAGDYELLRIADPGKPFIVAYVFPENYDSRVRFGNVVNVKMPGNGRTIKAKVIERPTNANNIPGGLSESILAGRRSIVVFLEPVDKLLPEELVNGMPVEVDWGIRFIS